MTGRKRTRRTQDDMGVLFSETRSTARLWLRLRRSAQGDREGDPSARAGCALLDGDDSETLQNKF